MVRNVGFNFLQTQKSPNLSVRAFNLVPGSVLLSHGETPHYHRRYCVSLLSSAWSQVGPQCYGRQAITCFALALSA